MKLFQVQLKTKHHNILQTSLKALNAMIFVLILLVKGVHMGHFCWSSCYLFVLKWVILDVWAAENIWLIYFCFISLTNLDNSDSRKLK